MKIHRQPEQIGVNVRALIKTRDGYLLIKVREI